MSNGAVRRACGLALVGLGAWAMWTWGAAALVVGILILEPWRRR